MIISRAEIASAISAYRAVKRKPALVAVTAEGADSFEPSSTAAALESAFTASVAEPFYRRDLVEELRRRISLGRYHVPSEQIIEKLLGRLIVDAAAAAA